MNIHFLLTKDFFRGGGIETYTREVGRRLIERGHRVTVYSTRGNSACPHVWEGMRFIWLPRIKPYWAEKTCGGVFAAMRALREDAPDVFHLHSVVAGSLAPILRAKGIPCVLQMHGIEWQRSRWGLPARTLLRAMERASLSAADAITAVSNTQCEYFKVHYAANCEFIPTAADIKEYAQPNLISEMGLRFREYVLFAARLVPEKGAHHLIRAYRRLATDRPLIIAGEAPAAGGYAEELRKLAREDSRIRFIGRVQGRLLEELFSNAAVFVQPSELEGLSIGLLEAMSYGIQCLASDIPANREVVGDAALLFRNKDVDDLERQLTAALSNGTGDSALRAAARDRVEKLFSWKGVVDQLETLYERVVSSRKTEGASSVVPRSAKQPRTIIT
jgi:glycosyltransferase involved in cell wall biosynthesis